MMVGFSFLQVLLRTLLTHGNLHWVNTLMSHMDWMEPLSRLLVLWLTFLGASLVTGENRHIKIDIMSALLPAKWSPYRGFVLSLACTIIMALMLRSSIGYLRSEMEFGTEMFLSIPT
ncbi:MAG: TRAP transporter small permease subunit, partial [Deltaproteobacteria bacterium]|nr:TRAP transporter small permease subunit [Deltaproteobacteria bacterium]